MNFIIKLLTSRSGLSSKRFCGIVGWIICLIVMCGCAIANQQAPEITDIIVITSATLLGVDSITNIWKK